MVAAGSGLRLGADRPKALVELGGVPLVRHCVEALAAAGVESVVVVAPDGHLLEFERVLEGVRVPVLVIPGGTRRQDSVRAGAEVLARRWVDAIVLVHDAARPLTPVPVIESVIGAVRTGGGVALPTLPLHDSVRLVDGHGSKAVDRSSLRAVQTPQGMPLATLLAAHTHLQERGLEVTDDASAAELLGESVGLVPGHRDAMKVTEPLDLVLADAILGGRSG